MTMGSLFGSAYAEQDYASQNPGDIPSYPWAPNYEPEEDPAALWAQQEEELRRQGLMAQFAYPNGAPATYGPYQPSSIEQLPYEPTLSEQAGLPRGGFRQSEQLIDPNQRTDNPLALLGAAYGAGNIDVPIYSNIARNVFQPAAGFVGEQVCQQLDPLGLWKDVLPFSGPEAGRFAGEAIIPIGVLDLAANALFASKGAGLIERVTGVPGFDDFARNAARGMFPEQLTVPGLNCGPTGGGYDYPSDLKENAAEAVDPRYPLPIDPLDPITQARAARAGPGYIEGGTTPGIIDSIEQAHPPNVAGYGQPVAIEGGRAFPAGG